MLSTGDIFKNVIIRFNNRTNFKISITENTSGKSYSGEHSTLRDFVPTLYFTYVHCNKHITTGLYDFLIKRHPSTVKL